MSEQQKTSASQWTGERWVQLEDIIQSALERQPGEWPAFLERICDGDPSLRAEAESLLVFQPAARDFIETPAYALASELFSDEEQRESVEGRMIGPYRVLREIGHGGMGAVYLAARADEQYSKQVAIKLLRPGLDTTDIRRRFRHERQILASLDHTNIARLLDGGTTEDGLPFFVMDYVEGSPIDEYCDQHKLSTVERLKLFRSVCSAVHYAHQNLVIHRDIKSGNILVTEEGIPKLLDFGIAKLLKPYPFQGDVQTVTALGAMTPQYASPEQLLGDNVTTASDVYSLGVLLYELLTGRYPYHVSSHSPDEIARAIREDEPDKPSIAVTHAGNTTEDRRSKAPVTPEHLSEIREGTPERLRRRLKGDLDNIALMALRKEPQRRYSSVEQFSEDIRRYLDGLPILARTDAFGYRSAKFIKRNKPGVAAAALIALLVIIGIVATIVQERQSARLARIAVAERDKARLEQAKAERVSDFMQNVLSYADPTWYSPGSRRASNVKVIEALDEASKRLETELQDQPEIKAGLHHTIGNTYRALGYYDRAEQHLMSALALARKVYGEPNSKVAEYLYYLGAALDRKGNLKGAESYYRQAIAMMKAVDPENVNFPYMYQDLGYVLFWQATDSSGIDAAESFFNEALTGYRRQYGDEHPTIAIVQLALANVALARNDTAQAEQMLAESIALLRRLPDQQPLPDSLSLLAGLRTAKGEYAEAEALYSEALNLVRRFEGEETLEMAAILERVAGLHESTHEYDRAEREALRAIEIRRRFSAESVVSLGLLSRIALHEGRRSRAEAYAQQALTVYRSSENGEQPPYFAASTAAIVGDCLLSLNRYAEAEPLLVASYATLKSRYGGEHPETVAAGLRLKQLYKLWSKAQPAVAGGSQR